MPIAPIWISKLLISAAPFSLLISPHPVTYRDENGAEMKRFFVLTAFATLAALATGCAAGIGTSPKGEELPIEKAAIKFAADVKDGGYQTISAEGLGNLLAEKKDVVVIDTMPAADYAASHIRGAVNAPMPKSEKELTPAEKEALVKVAGGDKNKAVVTYCGFVACRRSHIAAKILVDEGYKNVSRLPSGIVGWKEGGFPLEP